MNLWQILFIKWLKKFPNWNQKLIVCARENQKWFMI